MNEEEKCPQCGKASNTVSLRPNAYAQEMNNDMDAEWEACDECDYQNKMDI